MSFLGPGFITGAADDDPSGIAVFSQAGSQFGLHTLWFAPFVFPLMLCVQEMSARIGLVTGRGIIRVVRDRYPPYVLWIVGLLTIPAVIVNIGADLLAMGAVLHMLVPALSVAIFAVLCALVILVCLTVFRYAAMASVLKWASCVLVAYVFVPFFVKQDWSEVIRSAIVPHVEFNLPFLAILGAFLGTNISAYLLFWESSMEVEDRVREGSNVDRARIRTMQKDNAAGMLVASLIMFFVLWACGTTLHAAGITSIRTVNEAALALRPIAGESAYLLFALGILASGFIAVPVLAGACGYIASESFAFPGGMSKRLGEAKRFYAIVFSAIVVSLVITLTGVGAVQALIFSAVIYGVLAPPAIYFIVRICNDRQIMGEFVNTAWSNVFGYASLGAMCFASGVLIWSLLSSSW